MAAQQSAALTQWLCDSDSWKNENGPPPVTENWPHQKCASGQAVKLARMVETLWLSDCKLFARPAATAISLSAGW